MAADELRGSRGELQALDRLLGSSRLLSLTAIGGSGKTRLAIEFGRRVAQRYADGLWFVDLAPVISPDRVALEVARAAGIAEEANRPVEETLFRQVGSKRALLIVDNGEHVLDTCAALVGRLLAESEYLQVVITSREPLGVAGEQIIAVRPLSLPAPDVGRDLALASEAVQLFVDRARLVLPQFQVRHAQSPFSETR
jgi:predicted ATPase